VQPFRFVSPSTSDAAFHASVVSYWPYQHACSSAEPKFKRETFPNLPNVRFKVRAAAGPSLRFKKMLILFAEPPEPMQYLVQSFQISLLQYCFWPSNSLKQDFSPAICGLFVHSAVDMTCNMTRLSRIIPVAERVDLTI
jgi:hypothetical protein